MNDVFYIFKPIEQQRIGINKFLIFYYFCHVNISVMKFIQYTKFIEPAVYTVSETVFIFGVKAIGIYPFKYVQLSSL